MMWKNKVFLYSVLGVAVIAILVGATYAAGPISTGSSSSGDEGLSEPFVPTWYPPQENPSPTPYPSPNPYCLNICGCHSVEYTCWENGHLSVCQEERCGFCPCYGNDCDVCVGSDGNWRRQW